MATVSAAIAGIFHDTDRDKNQYQTPAAGDAVKSVMKTQLGGQSPVRESLCSAQANSSATDNPQTDVLERRELVNARSDKVSLTELWLCSSGLDPESQVVGRNPPK